jgi:hypothetical protein
MHPRVHVSRSFRLFARLQAPCLRRAVAGALSLVPSPRDSGGGLGRGRQDGATLNAQCFAHAPILSFPRRPGEGTHLAGSNQLLETAPARAVCCSVTGYSFLVFRRAHCHAPPRNRFAATWSCARQESRRNRSDDCVEIRRLTSRRCRPAPCEPRSRWLSVAYRGRRANGCAAARWFRFRRDAGWRERTFRRPA